jgi:hypothetical protein
VIGKVSLVLPDLEETRRGEMKKLAVLLVAVALLVATPALASDLGLVLASQTLKQVYVLGTPTGRYVFGMLADGKKYLLDTQTGRVWVLEKMDNTLKFVPLHIDPNAKIIVRKAKKAEGEIFTLPPKELAKLRPVKDGPNLESLVPVDGDYGPDLASLVPVDGSRGKAKTALVVGKTYKDKSGRRWRLLSSGIWKEVK